MAGGGHKGNKNGVKLKDEDVRQEAYRQYCAHIAEGKPKQSFFFNSNGFNCTWETLDKYIADNPAEFPSFLMKEAKAKRYQRWMEHGHCLMNGKYKGGSPVVWQTIMRNMFRADGWDNFQTHVEERTSADKILDKINNGNSH